MKVETILLFSALIIFSYLTGSINFSIIISGIKGKDIRKLGSGNPGTMNMSRNFGIKTGLLIFVLDVMKGALPTFIGYIVFKDKFFENTIFNISDMTKYMCGFFAVFGHILPLYTKFKGGKGIASTIGVFLVGEPLWGVIFMLAALAFILITAMGSMGSLIAITPPAIAAQIDLYNKYGLGKSSVFVAILLTDIFVLGICFMTWVAHRKNIKRLIEGEEHETSWSSMIKKYKLRKKAERIEKKEEKAVKNNIESDK